MIPHFRIYSYNLPINQWLEHVQKQKESVGVHHFVHHKKQSGVIVAVRVEMQYVKWLLHVTTVRDV